jgi:hypothetical protein
MALREEEKTPNKAGGAYGQISFLFTHHIMDMGWSGYANANANAKGGEETEIKWEKEEE